MKQTKHFIITLILILITISIGYSEGSNLLPTTEGQWHYGFEGNTLVDQPNWEEIGTNSGIDSVNTNVRSGIRSCRLENLVDEYGSAGREIRSATCTVTGGQAYNAAIWAYVPSTNT